MSFSQLPQPCRKHFASTVTAGAMVSQDPAAGHIPEEQGQAQGQMHNDYSTWSAPRLVARITELERQLHSQTARFASSSAAIATKHECSSPLSQPTPIVSSIPTDSNAPGEPTSQPPEKSPRKAGSTGRSSTEDITRTRAPGRPAKEIREIDPSKYHTRYVALKFAYLGQRYNGFEHANGHPTPLPTIEEELWKALRKTRLILPTITGLDNEPTSSEPRALKPYSISWDGCNYSKAGRTDRGVSAFGQVIGIRLRSARPKLQPKKPEEQKEIEQDSKRDGAQESIATDIQSRSVDENWDDVADELPYIHMLNRVLPEDIRVLAWCPNPPPDFDARFSCRERQYKYFFTQPAFGPTPGPSGLAQGTRNSKFREGWLDINAMRKAAKYFEGTHDFRNFCKVDTSKQIENFDRVIYYADIELVDPKIHTPSYVGKSGFKAVEDGEDSETLAQVYTFTLHGSAFLWHQVRHIVGILFLIGQGLEQPSIVSDLLNVSENPRRPTYEMASDAPLVLWDCIFPDETTGSREDSLNWIYAGDSRRLSNSRVVKSIGKFDLGGVVDDLWSVWRRRKVDEILAGTLLDLVVGQGDQSIIHQERPQHPNRGHRVFYGGNEAKLGGKYVPVKEKRKMDPVEVLNERWLASKQRRKGTEPNNSKTI